MEGPRPARDPDAIDAARVLAGVLLLMALVSLAGSQFRSLPREALGAVQHLGFLAVPLVYARFAGLRLFASSGYSRLGRRSLGLVVLASLGSLWLLKAAADFQTGIFAAAGRAKEHEQEVKAVRDAVEAVMSRGTLLAFPLMVLAPALSEETLFRGILFRGLARSFGPWISLLSTTVLFAAMHQSMVRFGLMVCLGLYLGALVWLTRSLWAGVLAHAINNLTVVVLQGMYGDRLDHLRAPWWMLLLSGVVFALALGLLWMEHRRGEREM